jgi:hypothetical protein
MPLPGLLVEYLVVGALTLTWLFPLLHSRLPTIDAPLLPLVFLLLYVLGMVVDFLAFFLTRIPKHWIRRRVSRRYLENASQKQQSGMLRQATIAMYAPELAKELAMRSSRDRIARGSLVNAVLATIFVLPAYFGAPLIALAAVLWAAFESVSFAYELCAWQIVEEKLQRETLEPAA